MPTSDFDPDSLRHVRTLGGEALGTRILANFDGHTGHTGLIDLAPADRDTPFRKLCRQLEGSPGEAAEPIDAMVSDPVHEGG